MGDLSYKLVIVIVLAAALVVLVLLLFLQRKRGRGSSRNYYIEALHALIDNRTDDALQLLMRAVKRGESSTDAYLQLGNLLREKGHHDRALQVHKSLMVRRDLGDDEEKAVVSAIAEDFDALGRTDRAIQTLEGLAGRRKDAEIMLLLHRLYHRSANYDKAYSALKDVVRLDRVHDKSMLAGYLASVADSLMRRGNRGEAEKYIEQAKREKKDSIPALYLAGSFEMEQGDLVEAAKNWEKILQTDIGCFDEVLPLLQKALYESGRFQELEKTLNKLIQSHPEYSPLYVALASFYEKKGELDRAIQIIEDEKHLLSRDAALAVRLASLQLQRGDDQSARRTLGSIDLNASKQPIYYCSACGHISSAPLSYCDSCSSFDSFTRHYEEKQD